MTAAPGASAKGVLVATFHARWDTVVELIRHLPTMAALAPVEARCDPVGIAEVSEKEWPSWLKVFGAELDEMQQLASDAAGQARLAGNLQDRCHIRSRCQATQPARRWNRAGRAGAHASNRTPVAAVDSSHRAGPSEIEAT